MYYRGDPSKRSGPGGLIGRRPSRRVRSAISAGSGYAERHPLRWTRWAGWALLLGWLAWFFAGDAIMGVVRAHLAAADMHMPVRLTIEAEGPFHRYDIVPLSVALRGPGGQPITGCRPEVRVWRSNAPMRDAGGRRTLKVHYDADHDLWLAQWAMPEGTHPGRYAFEVTVSLPAEMVPPPPEGEAQAGPLEAESEERTETTVRIRKRESFEVAEREAKDVPPGLCVATLEAARDIRALPFYRPDGHVGDWRALFDWAEYVGVDAVFVQGPTTDTRDAPLPHGSVFAAANLAALPDIIAECQGRGLRLGVWMPMMRVFGTVDELPPYEFGAVSANTLSASVSFFDELRPQHLIEGTRWLDRLDGVDYIGFDYMRDEPQAFDCVDQFVADMDPSLPEGWTDMELPARQKWLSDTWNHYTRSTDNLIIFTMWNWWRAHRVAQIMAHVVGEAAPEKPVWGFTLSWNHGIEHGQDPLMLADAGLDMDAVMLYQIDGDTAAAAREKFDAMMRKWRDYTRPELTHEGTRGAPLHDIVPIRELAVDDPQMTPVNLRLIVGNQVDDSCHQKSRVKPAPEEYCRRLTEALKNCATKPPVRGMFVHDLWRLATTEGNKGPYPGTEWGAAAAAAMSQLRATWDRVPVTLEVVAPETVTVGEPFDVELHLSHRPYSPPAYDVQLELLPADGIVVHHVEPGIANLDADRTAVLHARLEVSSEGTERAGRFMLPFRVRYQATDQFPHVTAFAYVHATR
jgi:hypothetical protein